MVVVFASDDEVRSYAYSVGKRFMANGIDVIVQVAQGGSSDTSAEHDIRPDQLASEIASSTCDYLVVIGDRNMRNASCHVRAALRVENPT